MRRTLMTARISSVILVLCSVCLEQPVAAQHLQPEDDSRLYELRDPIYDDKFYREHVPLDGAAVPAIPFRKDSLYGFVAKASRKWIIEPRFSQVFAVYREGAIVEVPEQPKGSKNYGVVGYDGRFIISPAYRQLYRDGDLYHGLRYGFDSSRRGTQQFYLFHDFYSKEGTLLFSAPAHDYATFSGRDTMAWFRHGREFSIYGRSGKLLKRFPVSPNRHFVGIFNHELVFAEKPQQAGQAYTGQTLAGKQLWRISSNMHASAVFRMSPQVFAFLTESGFYLTDAAGKDKPYGISNDFIGNGFEDMYPLMSALSLIAVRDFSTEKTGYIDRSGKLVVPCRYRYGGRFKNGEAPVLDSAREYFSFIDSAGNTVVPPVIPAENAEEMIMLGQAPEFSDGLCLGYTLVLETDSLGEQFIATDEDGRTPYRPVYFDRQGTMRLQLPDSIAMAGAFSDGLAPVVVRESRKLGFIDTNGRMVIPARYELAIAGAYPFPQVIIPKFINGYAYIKSFKGYLGKDGYEYFSGQRVQDHYDFSH